MLLLLFHRYPYRMFSKYHNSQKKDRYLLVVLCSWKCSSARSQSSLIFWNNPFLFLLNVAFVQLCNVYSLSSFAQFAKLQIFGDSVDVLSVKGHARVYALPYGSEVSSASLSTVVSCSGEGSRIRGWGLVRFLIMRVKRRKVVP